jgi:GAF domain-containing protein
VKPIPETIAAAGQISRYSGEDDVIVALQRMGDQVSTVVPDCIGLSIAWAEYGVTFTLAASDAEIAVFDALQYLEDGPCVESIRSGELVETDHDQLMSEQAWRLFSAATAGAGIRSTLTFPIRVGGQVVGTVNMYGASDHAFEGHHEELAEICGAYAPDATSNADLTFDTREAARQTPENLRHEALVDRAVGMIVAQHGVDMEAARGRLQEAALRAGIAPHQLAAALVQLQS